MSGKEGIARSEHSYEWLGHGAYFWENDSERALSWAAHLKKTQGKIKDPFVLGAVIDLGNCLNLVQSRYLGLLKDGYENLLKRTESLKEMPANTSLKENEDLVVRKLDCAVIELICDYAKNDNAEFDSVRGVFFEGGELYPNAGFREKNHIQVCVRNTALIKGYFRVL